MLDGEASGLRKLTDVPAAGSELDKVRKVAKNRLINRILKGGRFELKHGNAKGAISTETVNAQTIQVTLLKAPEYLTDKGKPSKVGKAALALSEAGTALCEVAQDAELETLLAGVDSED